MKIKTELKEAKGRIIERLIASGGEVWEFESKDVQLILNETVSLSSELEEKEKNLKHCHKKMALAYSRIQELEEQIKSIGGCDRRNNY